MSVNFDLKRAILDTEKVSNGIELKCFPDVLLLFIDRMQPKGFLIAATNLARALDPAVWRRFNEVIWFDKSDRPMIERFLRLKFKNVATTFDAASHSSSLKGYSYAEIERVRARRLG
jgi:SpoVK/Ycf46/Vps4 family AAA+-type ATPase